MPSGSSYIPVQKSAYPVLLALFTTIFVLSNIVSTKGVQVGPLVTDGAFFLFPAAYVIGDVISECYGFRAARRAVWTGFLAMIIAVSTFYVAILLPAASFYEGQAAFAVTLGLVPRIVVASLSGYAAGQLLNAWLLTLMKDRLGERGLWKRLVGAGGGVFACGARHIAGSSRQADAEGVFIDELNHAAAIKTGGSSAAAPFVRRTDKAHAVQHQLLRTLGMIDIADADGLDFSGKSVGVGRRTVFAR